MQDNVPYTTMSDREKYYFDLRGYIVVEDFLTEEEVKALNDAIDANEDKASDFGEPHQESEALKGEKAVFRSYTGMMEWPQPWCQPFRNLLAHKKLIPYLNTMLGRGWKVDHGFDVVRSEKGCEGLHLHSWGNAVFDPARYYHYQNGRMRCATLVLQYALADTNPGDGGLCIIPGSHKANFPLPKKIRYQEEDRDIVYQVPLKAGGLVIFNEATTHGTLPWKGEHERRTIICRYGPKYFHWTGGSYTHTQPEWVSELTEAQQAVLEPPYIYDRPLIEDDGETLDRPHLEADGPPVDV